MAVLRIAVAMLALGACYSPELRDCTVSCARSDDCGPGQLCGSDRWCAGPDLIGRCETGPGVDAPALDAAASAVDASADAAMPVTVMLVVQVSGHGTVTIASVGTCSDTSPGNQCSFAVTPGVPRALVAAGTGGDEFERWMQACDGQGATCTLTPIAPTTMALAKFKH